MANLKILIIEDDLSFQLELEMLIKEIGYEVSAAVDNAGSSLEQVFSNPPDLILMDIHIKGELNGVQIAEKIAHLAIPVLFITSVTDQATYEKTQGGLSIGYLVKPVDPFTLRTSIELALQTLPLAVGEEDAESTGSDSIFLKKKGLLHKVTFQEILYMKADGDYCQIHTGEDRFIITGTLGQTMKILPAKKFLRIHKGYVVQLNAIKNLSLSQNKLSLGGEQLPVGRVYKRSLLAELNIQH